MMIEALVVMTISLWVPKDESTLTRLWAFQTEVTHHECERTKEAISGDQPNDHGILLVFCDSEKP